MFVYLLWEDGWLFGGKHSCLLTVHCLYQQKTSHVLISLFYSEYHKSVKLLITLFGESRVLPIRRFRTRCPVWSRQHSGTAEPWDSGREKRHWAGSRAAAPSCGGSDCRYTHGGGGECRGDPAQVSARSTRTHRNEGYSVLQRYVQCP